MSSFDVKTAPFIFKGVRDVSACKTSNEVMIAAGLDWEVAKCELVAKMPSNDLDGLREDGFVRSDKFYKDVPNDYSVYRTDNNVPLGVVKGRYTPVQNIDAFKFFDDAIGKDKAIFQTAGCFGEGERIFVSAKLPNGILVNGEDPVDNYLVFTTTHDGSGGVKAEHENHDTDSLGLQVSKEFIPFTLSDLTNLTIEITNTQTIYDFFRSGRDILIGTAKNPYTTKINSVTNKSEWKKNIEVVDVMNNNATDDIEVSYPSVAKVVKNVSLQMK